MNTHSKFFIHDSDRVARGSPHHLQLQLDPEPLSQALITVQLSRQTTALLTTALLTTYCSELAKLAILF